VTAARPGRTPGVVIAGGGISGLAAAYEFHTRGIPFVLADPAPRLGGVIRTDVVDGFVIDAGPDALLTQKPAAVALCRDLGTEDRLRPMQARSTYVVRGGRLRPLPPGAALGIPTSYAAFGASGAFSLAGKLRMAAEYFVPPLDTWLDDESIASFIGRRFGREAVEYLADPLLAGIHGGDADRLSMRMLFPRLLEAERQSRSVIRAFRAGSSARAGGRPSTSPFVAFREGLRVLVDALVAALPAASLRLGVGVQSLLNRGDEWDVQLTNGERFTVPCIFVATPPRVTATLVSQTDAVLSELCQRIRSVSVVTVAVGYKRRDVAHPLNGSGFVVPRVEGGSVSAVSWVSSKWEGRAPDDRVLLRAYVGGSRDPGAIDQPEETLIRRVREDFRRLLAIEADPVLTRVYRWPLATPQMEVGHGALLEQIQYRLESLPGLSLSASGFRGSGIADCVGDARTQAVLAADRLRDVLGTSDVAPRHDLVPAPV
jgi:oxygen-dependent protoporphyrinogen oxidase